MSDSKNAPKKRPEVAVVGLGPAGCVTAAALASLGHAVIGFDPDTHLTDLVNSGQYPVFEPHLGKLLQDGVQAGRLTATNNLKECVQEVHTVFLCLPIDFTAHETPDYSRVRRICMDLAPLVDTRRGQLTVVLRTESFPGITDEAVLPVLPKTDRIRLVVNPPMMRAGSAVKDLLEASMMVFGSDHRPSAVQVAGLFRGVPAEPSIVSRQAAEFFGLACSSFHALKVTFANEVGAMAESLGLRADEIMSLLAKDRRLNASSAYLAPGLAYGGLTMPRDVKVMADRAAALKVKTPLLAAIHPSNEAHLQRVLQQVSKAQGDRIGVYGLSFKQNTDNTQGSTMVEIVERLVKSGKSVRIFDPQIQFDKLHGDNWHDLLFRLPLVERLLTPSLDELLKWSQHMVIAHRPDSRHSEQILASGVSISDFSYPEVHT